MLAAIVGGALWLRHDCATREGRARWDRVILVLPVAGAMVRKLEAARRYLQKKTPEHCRLTQVGGLR